MMKCLPTLVFFAPFKHGEIDHPQWSPGFASDIAFFVAYFGTQCAECVIDDFCFVSTKENQVARLRAVVGPFLLRRVKTDPGILPDLPDRQVIRADCTLTREQVGAYEAVVADMMGALEELRQAAREMMDRSVPDLDFPGD